MASTTRTLRRYDHRLRDLVRSTGDIGHAAWRGVPRSIARGWFPAAASSNPNQSEHPTIVSNRRRMRWFSGVVAPAVVALGRGGGSPSTRLAVSGDRAAPWPCQAPARCARRFGVTMTASTTTGSGRLKSSPSTRQSAMRSHRLTTVAATATSALRGWSPRRRFQLGGFHARAPTFRLHVAL